jgi:hypothetical protein
MKRWMTMATITDAQMHDWWESAAPYTIMILSTTARYKAASDRRGIIREHARRMMSLQADGILPIVCPARDHGDLAGIGIFAAAPDRTARIMVEDPGVRAGLFSYEVHPCSSKPGSVLPPS